MDRTIDTFEKEDSVMENTQHAGGSSDLRGGEAFGFGNDEGSLPVDPAPYPDLSHSTPQAGEPRDLRLLSDIELELCVEIGRARLPLRQLLALTPGSVIELDRALGEPVNVLVNGKLVARGQIVTIAEEFGVRISEIIDPSVEPPPSKRRG